MNSKTCTILITVLGCFLSIQAIAGSACPPPGYSKQQLLQLQRTDFELDDDRQRNLLAIALPGCLADPDSALRDGVAFGALANWMRGQRLSKKTRTTLFTDLVVQIASHEDNNGFQQPFAALVLSELARTDRIKPWFTPAMRDRLVNVTATYLDGVRDYRGFSETEGWRHGVAHAADLVLQLVLNPAIDAAQMRPLLAALFGQVAPKGTHSYIYGEPSRLARAAFYAYRRGVLDESAWTLWFETISNPGPWASWADSYSSTAGLAKRHNTLAFLFAINTYATAAGDDSGTTLATIVMQAIERVMSR